jgi:16S rRNA (cytidine1402-2'-O)-methyltransferase
MHEQNSNGSLYLVSTPIGNLGDITGRAIKVLESADAVLAEDTRVTGKLLKHLGLEKKMHAYHDHNKERKTPGYLELLRSGKNLALVTDAGTPGIADPAYYIVKRGVAQGIPVVSIPGPSAVLAALVASGLPPDRFVFENYLPAAKGKRRQRIKSWHQEKRTVVFYESPYKIHKTLELLQEILGDGEIVVARELTKLFEEFLRGKISWVREQLTGKRSRGEFTVLLHPEEPYFPAGAGQKAGLAEREKQTP